MSEQSQKQQSQSSGPSPRERANAIRALSMDAVQQANSGHPGAPMGMADIAEVLWNGFMRHNPANPHWSNRDRFVLSNGHGSMLLYSLLHLTGYDLPMEELRNFRQLHSKTPGHPEYGVTPGVETTTGPLGQGIAAAVGMALAEKMLAAHFNQPGHALVDHSTYVFAGDGCLMEGISHEVCSLAGTLKLGKLILFYDDNGISIDGEVEGWFTDDTGQRFEAYGWHVISDVDGHDSAAVKTAIEQARAESVKPSIICCKTTIGWGSPNTQGTEACHGAALGEDEIALVRETIGWPHPPFEIPDPIYAAWDARAAGARLEADWQRRFEQYQQAFPALAAEFERRMAGGMPEDWTQRIERYIAETAASGADLATRQSSKKTLDVLGLLLPELIGGSADLTPSNGTLWSGAKVLNTESFDANYLSYGVREFGMAAMMNGMVLHAGLRPYGGTFLVFSDYARNAVRLAALMSIPTIFVFTHDSIGLGEDGPTHQAVEHLASLRLMPNLSVWRPCDDVETAVAWRHAIEPGLDQGHGQRPTCLVLTRQKVPHQARNTEQITGISKGAYVLVEGSPQPDAIIIATGSEVALAVDAAQQFNKQGRAVRVVSMPCADLFDEQPQAYRDGVLPPDCRHRIAVEAGSSDYWYKYVGLDGTVIGMQSFGESAPAEDLFRQFGFTVEAITGVVDNLLPSR